jgi:hypothetical protein
MGWLAKTKSEVRVCACVEEEMEDEEEVINQIS